MLTRLACLGEHSSTKRTRHLLCDLDRTALKAAEYTQSRKRHNRHTNLRVEAPKRVRRRLLKLSIPAARKEQFPRLIRELRGR